ncbi:MAG: sigma-54-dependent Fis family transcriptional regulator [Deltaproteobacteria bacterium]|nr:sigma-54-dependent Fis family transcriptional regulator [Deltaproteobacteria bacterium]
MAPEFKLLVISDSPSAGKKLQDSGLPETRHILYSPLRKDIPGLLEKEGVHVVLIHLDLRRRKSEALRLLKKIKDFDALIDVLIADSPSGQEDAMKWIAEGATEVVPRPIRPETLRRILAEISRKRALRRDTLRLEQKLEKKYTFHGIIGRCPHMLETFSLIRKIASYFTSVLITGETGTGKELVARAIHKLSGTKNKRLVVCDCVAIPESLFESEFFGYVKGAFTGADRDKKGLFEIADQGIIFLDEIGEIPVSVQAKLLRVLEHRQFRPLGSNETRSVNVRVLAATSKNLREGIRRNTFREDLFHRLNKVEIHLLPLRKKPEDIPLLARHFLALNSKRLSKELKGLSLEVQKLFHAYPWPGNVRELENVLESASVITRKNYIDIPDLPRYLQEYHSSLDRISFIEREDLSSLEELEKNHILHILKVTENNIRRAAGILGISRTTLYSKLKKYGLRPQ